jgi:hypothetical protein
VDETVFALAEQQPGFAKVFFYLEQEAMKPRYEIHSIGMPEVVDTAGIARRELAARAVRGHRSGEYEPVRAGIRADAAANPLRGIYQPLPDAVPG